MTDVSDRAWARAQIEGEHNKLDVAVDGGKYRIIQAADGGFYAFRNNSYWPAYGQRPVFDNMLIAFVHEVERLREGVAEIIRGARDTQFPTPVDAIYAERMQDLLDNRE